MRVELHYVKFLDNRALFPDISTFNTDKLTKSMWAANIQEVIKEKKFSIRKKKNITFGIPSSKSIFKHLTSRNLQFAYNKLP